MSKKFLYISGIILTILIGSYAYWVYCCNGCTTQVIPNTSMDESNSSSSIKSKNVFPFEWSDSLHQVYFRTLDNFKFRESDSQLINPVSTKVDSGAAILEQLLTQHPNLMVGVKGYYSSSETHSSLTSDLGIERASQIKSYLIDKGIPETNIYIKSEINNELTAIDSVLQGPITVDIGTRFDIASQYTVGTTKELTTQLNQHPLRLYFNSNQDEILITQSKSDSIDMIFQYINQVPGSKIRIVGHSDATGDPEYNKMLALQRAQYVEKHFKNLGVESTFLLVESAGQTAPIASNNTVAGRALNRRSEISIQ